MTDSGKHAVAAMVRKLYRPGDKVEIRAWDKDENKFVGIFNYGDELVNSIYNADHEMHCDVYVCLNPTKLSVTSGLVHGEGSKKHDISIRRWFLLDGDPVRDFIRDAEGNPIMFPVMRDGKQIVNKDGSLRVTTKRHKVATDEEWRAAYEVMVLARNWLLARGWKEEDVIIASSGNGVHLLVRCDLPNTDESERLISGTQQAVSDMFSTEQVEIECFADADRITRAYGTLNRKGSEAPRRTHRRSKLL